ncbi:MAG: polar amino acid transport system substrate-binding protein [Pyrinomonadaceae bacterium]|nr:polar amino acid transport system substrate-binding protein [Pyrinomonadaceae bacterium]
MENIVAIVGVCVALALGIPAIILQRRQTRLAEEARRFEIAASRVDVFQRMHTGKRLRVGYVHYPPFAIAPMMEHEPPAGLYIDLMRRLCESDGIVAEFRQVRFASALSKVVGDELDVVLCIFQTPRRSQTVDFSAFLHSVSVSGVTRRQEDRISSQSDLVSLPLRFVVCRGEIGHEIIEDHLKIPEARVTVIDTSNVADIIEMVAAKKADVAIADSLSCQHGLAARGAEGPKLKPILRRRPLYLCPNGVMFAREQDDLADWLDTGLKALLREPEFRKTEETILEDFHGTISKI